MRQNARTAVAQRPAGTPAPTRRAAAPRTAPSRRTAPPQETAPPVEAEAVPIGEAARDLDEGVSPAYLLDRLWRLFTAKRTGLTLILAMGALSLAGTLLEQVPDGVRGDPQAYASWLDSVRPRYGGWTTVLNAAGGFQVFSSVWFKSVSVLLAVSILACSVHRAPQLWKRAVHPRIHVADAFFTRAGTRVQATLPVPPGEALQRAHAVLRSGRYRIIEDPRDPARQFYADRNRFGPFGTILAHVAFVLILIGVLLTAATGFKDTQFAATVGSRVDVGHGTGLTVEAKSFTDAYYTDGSPKDYASELVLYRDGAQVASRTVRVNQPMRWRGVTFYQSFFGTSAAMRVRDGSGKTLFDSGVPLMWTSDDGKHSIGQFPLPAQNLTVYVVAAASGEVDGTIQAGQMQLEVYRSGQSQPITTQVVSQGKPATISGLEFTFMRERQFTGLIVARDPGALWVWIGSALMVLGLFLVFFFPHRRVWVRVRGTAAGSEVWFASPMRHDSMYEARFHQFATDVALPAGPGGRQDMIGPRHA